MVRQALHAETLSLEHPLQPGKRMTWRAELPKDLRQLEAALRIDPELADENLWVDTEDAYAMARRLAREEGLLIGISAAANVVGASRVAKRLADQRKNGLVVTILCDGGQKYLSEPFWND